MAFSTTPSDGADRLLATADNQTINALAGNDWIRSTFNASTIYGGLGHDRISVALDLIELTDANNLWSASLYGGSGNDWLVSNFSAQDLDEIPGTSFELTSRQSGGSGDDNIFISVVSETLFYTLGVFDFDVYGGAGNDNIWIEVSGSGAYNLNFVDAGSGADIVYISFEVGEDYDGGSNEVYAGEGNDDVIVSGGAGWANGFNDNFIWGEDGNDRLEALTIAAWGFNRVFGGEGDDTLIATGDVGGDPGTNLRNSVWGGDGNDAFVFLWSAGATPAVRDTIYGFGSAALGDDVIDVSAVDANVNVGGNQEFTFGWTSQKGVGFLWVEENPDTTGSLVMANTGGPQPLVIAIEDWSTRDATDWRAGDFGL